MSKLLQIENGNFLLLLFSFILLPSHSPPRESPKTGRRFKIPHGDSPSIAWKNIFYMIQRNFVFKKAKINHLLLLLRRIPDLVQKFQNTILQNIFKISSMWLLKWVQKLTIFFSFIRYKFNKYSCQRRLKFWLKWVVTGKLID